MLKRLFPLPSSIRLRPLTSRLRSKGSNFSTKKSTDAVSSTSQEPNSLRSRELSFAEASQAGGNSKEYDLVAVRKWLAQQSGRAAIVFRNGADEFTASAKSTFTQLGSELNRLTGYEGIEALKRHVVEQEGRINAARKAAREAKTAYEDAAIQRSQSQREVNDLLQRKSNWTESDVSRFTNLVRQDQLYEQAEARAKAQVRDTEDTVEKEFRELMRAILERYHEEQVWSDKIRSASTYGSLAVLGLNLIIFILAIVVVEPWKRRRLAHTFEKKIEEMSKENAAMVAEGMQEIAMHLEEQNQMLSQTVMIASQQTVKAEPQALDSRLESRSGQRSSQGGLATAAVVVGGAIGWLLSISW